MTNDAQLYEHDFYRWTEQQARLLKTRDFAALHVDGLNQESSPKFAVNSPRFSQ